MRIVEISAIGLFLISFQSAAPQHQKQVKATPASPDTVCNYITGKMTAGLSQVPTLCSAKEAAPGWYDISVFSPTDVLERGMRRAWSALLFQTLQELGYDATLHGACSEAVKCKVKVADTYLSQHQWHYSTFLTERHSHGRVADLTSDDWYFDWWADFYRLPEVDHPQSKENAERIGKDACTNYVNAVSRRWSGFSDSQSHVPTCSVLLATDSAVYLVADFSNVVDGMTANNLFDLPRTIGMDMENTGYTGELIVRTPWEHPTTSSRSGDFRQYKMIDIRSLVFLYEELRSGLRTEVDVGTLLTMNFHFMGSFGQTVQLSFSDTSNSGGFEFRDAAVVKTIPNPGGGLLMTLTDGSVWSITDESMRSCTITTGSHVTAEAESANATPTVSVWEPGMTEPCKLKALFLGAW